jgi:hypothetical protein
VEGRGKLSLKFQPHLVIRKPLNNLHAVQGNLHPEQRQSYPLQRVANGLVYVGQNNGMVVVFGATGCGSSICLSLTQLQAPIGRLYILKVLR